MMLSRCAFVMLALFWLLAYAPPVNADSLRAARDAVRTPDPDPPPEEQSPPKKKKKNSTSHDCDDDDPAVQIHWPEGSGETFIVMLTSPFWLPHTILGDDASYRGYFASAPYEGTPGWMVIDRPLDGRSPEGVYTSATRLRLEYGDDFDSLSRFGGHLLHERSHRWGVDGELNYWREDIGGDRYDHLWTGDANVLYRFAQNEWVQMRAGVGVAWLSDPIDTELGINFTYGGEIYPVRPLVLTAEMDAGRIGEATIIHLRTTIGVTWQQVEVYSGYDYLEIGDAQLDGFIAGIRLLF